jgi:multiple sugar transport system permease protein
MEHRSARFLSQRQREALDGFLCVLPWLIGFLVFTAGPMLASLGLSFTRWNLLQPPVFNGIANYVRLIQDPMFWHSLRVTVVFTLISVPARLGLSLTLALLMTRPLRGMNTFRTIYYLPAIIGGVPMALLWMWVFNSDHGLLNYILSLNNIAGPNWLHDPDWAPWALIIIRLWSVGFPMLVFIAGLQNIPPHLYEAAEIDGANGVDKFFHVTLPMLSPTLFFVLVTQLIESLQVFDLVFALSPGTLGAPLRSLLVYILYFYQVGFRQFEMGYASALVWVLLMIILGLTALAFRSSNLWVFYESEVKK